MWHILDRTVAGSIEWVGVHMGQIFLLMLIAAGIALAWKVIGD